jgi:AraC-like DNA-binding protein
MIGLVLYESNNNRLGLSKYQSQIENAKIIMNENIFNNLSTEELAISLAMKYNKFRRLFRQITGFGPAHYFQELKMRKAKQMLLETAYSVKEISYCLNYQTAENFVTMFKTQTGYTPTEYRKFSRQLEPAFCESV